MVWRGNGSSSSAGSDRQANGGPPVGERAGHHPGEEDCYLINALALPTASVRACCGSTLLNKASWTALSTSWFTSAFFGIVGTMSAYVAMMSFASGRALSSI